jgi:hypothetical protein
MIARRTLPAALEPRWLEDYTASRLVRRTPLVAAPGAASVDGRLRDAALPTPSPIDSAAESAY